jgi:hypothetical protein
MKKPLLLRSILEQTLKGLELDGSLRTYSIWTAWKEIVGEPISFHAQPYAIRNRILFVEVSHSTWMQQLQFLKPTLLEKINAYLGESRIEDIRFRIGKIPVAAVPVPEGKKKKKESLGRKTTDQIERLIWNISDAEVRKGFKELFLKSALLEQSRKKSGEES